MSTLLLVIIVALVFLYIGLVLPYYATKIITLRETNKELSALIPVNVDESRMCNGAHNWLEAIAVENSEYTQLNVCRSCGFIPSKNLMATSEGLKRIILNNEMRAFEEGIAKDFSDKETNDINELIEEFKKDTTNDKAMNIYFAGQSANKRYIIYKIARSEEKKREQKDNV